MKILESKIADSQEEIGATLVEYAILVAMLAVVIIAAMTNFQIAVSKQYSQLGNQLGS